MSKKDEYLKNRIYANKTICEDTFSYCSDNCPFLTNDLKECTLYAEQLEGYYFNRNYPIRCKKCKCDVLPDSNAQVIELLKRICKKIGA